MDIRSRIDSFKYLGGKLDSRLTFSEHVAHIKSKTISKIKLGRSGQFLDWKTVLRLNKTLILLVFDYGDTVYHNLNTIDPETLHKLQNTACRSILKTDMSRTMNSTLILRTRGDATSYQSRRMNCLECQKFTNTTYV